MYGLMYVQMSTAYLSAKTPRKVARRCAKSSAPLHPSTRQRHISPRRDGLIQREKVTLSGRWEGPLPGRNPTGIFGPKADVGFSVPDVSLQAHAKLDPELVTAPGVGHDCRWTRNGIVGVFEV